MTDDKRQPGAAESVATEAARGDAEAARGVQRTRRRLKAFGTHLVAYFLVMIVIVPINYWLAPAEPWFVLPMVGWGSVLAVHAAYAMGLFDVFRGGSR